MRRPSTARSNFYPRPPRGGRHATYEKRVRQDIFLSTPSARRATHRARPSRPGSQNFYPRPPRGGRPQRVRGTRSRMGISIHALREEGDEGTLHKRRKIMISIHALREEGDVRTVGTIRPATDFYPRPPRGGRHEGKAQPDFSDPFLSTPSARRATISCKGG